MKKFASLLIGFLFICSLANGQYKINKTKYDFRAYSYKVGDPYNTGIAGVCSFLVPGLGQMVSGETGRGVAFLATDLGFSVMYVVGLLKMTEDIQNGRMGENGSGLFAAGAIGMLTVTIWSTIDAVRVAKVNNLAFRDKNKTSYNFKIQPFVSTINNYSIPKSVTGLTFIATF
jgi:hypothetical protein